MNTNKIRKDNGNLPIFDVKHSLSQLKEGDYIAFPFTYNGEQVEIIVDNITSVNDKEVLVHFLYGHHSLAEYIKKGISSPSCGQPHKEMIEELKGTITREA